MLECFVMIVTRLQKGKRERENWSITPLSIIFRKSNKIPNHKMEKLKHEMKNLSSCSLKNLTYKLLVSIWKRNFLRLLYEFKKLKKCVREHTC